MTVRLEGECSIQLSYCDSSIDNKDNYRKVQEESQTFLKIFANLFLMSLINGRPGKGLLNHFLIDHNMIFIL